MHLFLNVLVGVLTIAFTANGGVLNSDSDEQAQTKDRPGKPKSSSNDAVLYWNAVALQACANDYDTSIAATPDQPGPTAASRALAIIHGSMYDSMATFSQVFKPLSKPHNMPNKNNVQKESAASAAIAEAAYQTLYSLFPKQQSIFDAARNQYFSQMKAEGQQQAGIVVGILVGQLISAYILSDRQNDNSQINIPYTFINRPGYHQVDPTHPNQGLLGTNWGNVKPFFLNSGSQFRPPKIVGDSPSARLVYLNSNQYQSDFNESKSVASKTSTVRTSEQTQIGIFWAYDGAPKIGVPPRFYNQIVRVVAIQQKNTLEENAYLFALVNYAMADAGIAAWDCKYYYSFWRPIVGVRQATGYTKADPNWLPLGSPSDNNGTDFTPGFPSFVSGHSTFGSALFESLRQFYRTDNIAFQIQSDEFNGKTFDSNTKQIRPPVTRYYRSFSDAETENYLSRIYLGVHWRTDQEQGKILGRKVAQNAFTQFRGTKQ